MGISLGLYSLNSSALVSDGIYPGASLFIGRDLINFEKVYFLGEAGWHGVRDINVFMNYYVSLGINLHN